MRLLSVLVAALLLASSAHADPGESSPAVSPGSGYQISQGFGVAGTIVTGAAAIAVPLAPDAKIYHLAYGTLSAPMAAGGALGAGLALRRRGSPVSIVPGSIAMGASLLPAAAWVYYLASGNPDLTVPLMYGAPAVAVVGSAVQLGINAHAAKNLSAHVATGPSARLTATPRLDGGFEMGLTGRF